MKILLGCLLSPLLPFLKLDVKAPLSLVSSPVTIRYKTYDLCPEVLLYHASKSVAIVKRRCFGFTLTHGTYVPIF